MAQEQTWGEMIGKRTGQFLKYTIGGTLIIAAALFGADTIGHAVGTIPGYESYANIVGDKVHSFLYNIGAGDFFGVKPDIWLGGYTADSKVATYSLGSAITAFATWVDTQLGDLFGFLAKDTGQNVAKYAAGAGGGALLTAAAVKMTHTDRVKESRQKPSLLHL